MKSILKIIAAMLLLTACHVEPKGFIIEGTIDNAGSQTIYLMQGDKYVDSAICAENGGFAFLGQTKTPDFYYLFINAGISAQAQNSPPVLVDSLDHLTITADAKDLFRTFHVSGNKEADQINDLFANYIINYDRLMDIAAPGAEESDSALQIKYAMKEAVINDQKAFFKEFILEHPTSLISLVALKLNFGGRDFILNPDENYDFYKMLDDSLSKYYPKSKDVKILRAQMIEINKRMEMINAMTNSSVAGNKAPDFSIPDNKGNTIKLSDFLGKYVLLDFWASWCGPCRRESPYLIEVYNKYNKNGFEIFQVSLDKTKDAWLKGIKDDGLGKWYHGSDLKDWNCVPAGIYGVTSIPANFLIDPEGNIIARDLRGPALDAKLDEIF